MHSVSVSTYLAASPQDVWSKIGNPAGLSGWHPAFAESVVNGNERHLTLADGAKIREQIDGVDDANRSYDYRILESPLPIKDYVSTVKVTEAEGGCCVEWNSSFEVTAGTPAEMSGLVKGLYEAGMAALRGTFKG